MNESGLRETGWASRIIFVLLLIGLKSAAVQANGAYTFAAQQVGSAGNRSSSSCYNIESAICPASISGPAVNSTAYKLLSGFFGQIYEVTSLSLGSSLSQGRINENSGFFLTATATLDDGTSLAPAPSTMIWSWSRPVAIINPDGTGRTEYVYQDTPASVSASFGSITSFISLIVLNVTSDDFGLYANDGIDDSWQVQYFGLGPDGNGNAAGAADADPSGSGQNNLLKYLAGLNPLNPSSVFKVWITESQTILGNWDISFSPIVDGRTYIVESSPTLSSPIWKPLANSSETDRGDIRVVTDMGNQNLNTFYRIRIQIK